MNKIVLLVLTIFMLSLTGGCTFLGNAKKDFDESTNKPIPNVNNNPQATPQEEVAEAETEAEFADLEEEEQATQAIAGLIPATNPDTRVRSSVRGRQDPFSVVTLVPKLEIEDEEERKPQRKFGKKKGASELAQEVVISGLYESNGRTKLIVKAPEENTSRYVEVGQYLSNGQILVKRIDRNYFPTPRVILEQSGVEVAKTIGETEEDVRNRVSSLPTPNAQNETFLSNVSLNLLETE